MRLARLDRVGVGATVSEDRRQVGFRETAVDRGVAERPVDRFDARQLRLGNALRPLTELEIKRKVPSWGSTMPEWRNASKSRWAVAGASACAVAVGTAAPAGAHEITHRNFYPPLESIAYFEDIFHHSYPHYVAAYAPEEGNGIWGEIQLRHYLNEQYGVCQRNYQGLIERVANDGTVLAAYYSSFQSDCSYWGAAWVNYYGFGTSSSSHNHYRKSQRFEASWKDNLTGNVFKKIGTHNLD